MAKKKIVKKAAKKATKITAKKTAPKKLAKKPGKKAAKKPIKKAVSQKIPAKSMNFANLISPLDDRILVQLQDGEKMTAGGLYIPDSVDASGNRKAKVVAVGRGHLDKKGKIHSLEIRVGNMVLLTEHAGDEIEISGQKLKILRESDILGIVEK